MRHAVFHLFGGLPVAWLLGTQPGKEVSTRCAWKPSIKSSASLTMSARSFDLSQRSRLAAESKRSTVVQLASFCCGGWREHGRSIPLADIQSEWWVELIYSTGSAHELKSC